LDITQQCVQANRVNEKCTAEPTECEKFLTTERESTPQHKKTFYYKNRPPEAWFSSYRLVTMTGNVQTPLAPTCTSEQ